MPNYIIGKENLPNVYIDSVNIYDDTINVRLCMYDQDSSPTWFDNQYMSDMKIRLIATSNLDIINQINLSGSGILSFDSSDLDYYETIDITEVESSSSGENMEKYEYMRQFNFIGPTYGNPLLYLYACTMVDIDFFNNPQLNRYSGAVVGEKIFEGQEIPTESGYFYYPDTNEEYPGPVHLHNEEYMEGSVHTSSPHKIVRYVPETNAKIHDQREQE